MEESIVLKHVIKTSQTNSQKSLLCSYSFGHSSLPSIDILMLAIHAILNTIPIHMLRIHSSPTCVVVQICGKRFILSIQQLSAVESHLLIPRLGLGIRLVDQAALEP